MKITFHGAARKVTGSMFLLEFDDEYKVLIDCGSTIEGGSVSINTYETGIFPFDASLINLVILTHAHIDHSGQLPNLYQAGFEGQVLCTAPTQDLANLLLHDAASLNQRLISRVDKSSKKSKKSKAEASLGLYLSRQVEYALSNFVTIPFGQRFKFKDKGFLTFLPAGHLLGAAMIYIEYNENGENKTVGFSGDIGRKNYPLLVDPVKMPQVDHLIMETTYGSRFHTDNDNEVEILSEIIKESCIEKPGRLIIPAFSVGRTQALLYTLNRLYSDKNIQPIKVFTDSPLAKSSTQVHEKYKSYLNKEAKEFQEENDSLFDFENLEFLKSGEDSKAAANHAEPCIIISASGMIKGGRVEYHIAQNIENPYATVLLVGYVSEDSIGGKLLSGNQSHIHVLGKKLEMKAKIRKTDVFSGHADLADLQDFVRNQDKNKLKNIYLVHGESEAMLNFKNILSEQGYPKVEMPEQHQTFEI